MCVVALECGKLTRKLIGDCRAAKVEAFQHEWHNVALDLQSCLNLAAQPIPRFATSLQRGRREQHKEMGPRPDVFKDDAFEVATSYAVKIEEHVIAIMSQVLGDRQRPGSVGAAITG